MDVETNPIPKTCEITPFEKLVQSLQMPFAQPRFDRSRTAKEMVKRASEPLDILRSKFGDVVAKKSVIEGKQILTVDEIERKMLE